MAGRPKDETYRLLVADVYELAGTLRRRGDELAGAVGQTQARWQVLSVCSEGEWTVPDAARRLGVSRQAVQRVADLLVDDGLASFEPNPAHARSPHLRLTASGRDALRAIDRASAQQRADVAGSVTAADLATAHEVLSALLQRLRA